MFDLKTAIITFQREGGNGIGLTTAGVANSESDITLCDRFSASVMLDDHS